jgi:hypothetical protein
LHNIVPHEVTQAKIKLAHAPPLSPLHGDDAPIANLFGEFCGLSYNKRISNPRKTTRLTLARKKHGTPIRRDSYLKAQSVILEQLAKRLSLLLHISNSIAERNNHSSDQPVVPLNGVATTNLYVDGLLSDNDDC